MWAHENRRLKAAPWSATMVCEEEQSDEDADLTREIEQEKAQQAWEDAERSKQIEREKQEQKEKPQQQHEPVKPKPVKPKRKR